MKYFEVAKFLWQTYVPKSGKAETVQGELIRAIVRLKSEAHRNGNINWNKNFAYLATFIEDTLLNSGVFSQLEEEKIKEDISMLLDFEYPKTEDAIYDRITDRIVEWYFEHKNPILLNEK